MVERRPLKGGGTNGQEFVEFLFSPDGLKVIDNSNIEESLKRQRNRERTARQQGMPMSSVGWDNEHIEQQEGAAFNIVNNRPKRGTRGHGRKIKPKQA